ncbi:MAG: nucleotidyl transferase AbiEii/AbiGii toxin family protein [Acidimicrobiia bacterium]|nr:nucleotidyl transferase AbiEii/AbiGii toxin family protein [Acidimicrobiia bacterium]
MSDLEVALRRSVDDLSSMGRAFALVGGLAVSARAEPRLTRDVDLAVAVADDAEAEEVVRALRVCGYSVVSALEQETTGRLASVRLRSDTEGRGVIVDLLFASSGIEAEVAGDAERLEVLPGFVVPVARIGHLVAMKLLARDDRGRPADADDLAALRRVCDRGRLAGGGGGRRLDRPSGDGPGTGSPRVVGSSSRRGERVTVRARVAPTARSRSRGSRPRVGYDRHVAGRPRRRHLRRSRPGVPDRGETLSGGAGSLAVGGSGVTAPLQNGRERSPVDGRRRTWPPGALSSGSSRCSGPERPTR